MITIEIKKEFRSDYITREAGERLRQQIVEAVRNSQTVTVDFLDIVVASTSFLDEAFSKLADVKEVEAKDVERYLVIKNLDPRDKQVLDTVSKLRGSSLVFKVC